ncbi:MAG TPA: hypothetical protein VM369_08890 [Candidatus Binatia bacterium]|nr:hypothetical protein [Candidatus Binatia bacterium]
MFATAAAAALRILAFRAGPQDFPYSPRVTHATAGLMLIVSFLQYQLTLPAVQAAVQAAAATAAFAGLTWLLLSSRRLQNRATQTIGSLFATSALVALLLLPAFADLAPVMLRLAQDPQLAREETLPAGPLLGVLVLSAWNFAVTANIYRHALDTSRLAGVAIALLAVLATAVMSSAVSGIAAPAGS